MEFSSNEMEERILGNFGTFGTTNDMMDWNAFILGSSNDHLDDDCMLL